MIILKMLTNVHRHKKTDRLSRLPRVCVKEAENSTNEKKETEMEKEKGS